VLSTDICRRALDARDARFDGLFFVGITTTRVYCRPVCPARVSYPERRRFFDTAASAESAGFRPCLRCRPELAPGRALCDAVPRLARVAANRICAGALNGRDVASLAGELGVSERHLRRALEREIGVSPVELAQTNRLLLAKRLLADTSLSVTRIAFASGFQSLRRFNSVFRERYRMSPSALRRLPAANADAPRMTARQATSPAANHDLVQLTLAYRPPLAWGVLIRFLAREAIPGVESVDGGRYGRTVGINESRGVIFVTDAGSAGRNAQRGRTYLNVEFSVSLLPVLMPLLARLRQMFDLDAEPTVVDSQLERGGLGSLVRQHPGVRIPGAFDGFDAALHVLLAETVELGPAPPELGYQVARALGETFDSGLATLTRLMPTAGRVADAGAHHLRALGVPDRRAEAIVSLARAMADGSLTLEPGTDVIAIRRVLRQIEGISHRLATLIVMRALSWPDAFPASDPVLLRSAGETSSRALQRRAEQWRPWRTYAALHLWLHNNNV
jgi:AraC family transcriptional regulator of adaptative response / DNA-3-methyladenine glycosylase II